MTQIDRSEGLVGNTAFKAPCRCATTANITLSAEQTIDGIACVDGDRVLVKNQTTGSENGIWVVSTGSWNRSDDFDGSYDCTTGTMVRCVSGTTNANSVWKLDTTGTITIGTTSLTFTAASVGFDAQGMADFIHVATNKTTPVGADEVGIWDSVSGLLNRVSFTNLLNWFAAKAGSASQAFSALAVNTAKTTVASATTPDIFAVTTGQLIDYTGTATCTGFVAAPQAGMFRELYCADACLFTAGANLLIEGIPSGTTITLAAGALVQVRSITTTQFKMTYSVSGTFTATATGLTTSPTVPVYYSIKNGFASLEVRGTCTGTSNATTLTLTGLPDCLKMTTSSAYFMVPICVDDSTNTIATGSVGGNTLTLRKGVTSGAWTNTGSKGIYSCTFSFSLN